MYLFYLDASLRVLDLNPSESHIRHFKGRVEFAGHKEKTRSASVTLPFLGSKGDGGFSVEKGIFMPFELLVNSCPRIVNDVLLVPGWLRCGLPDVE